MNQLNDKVIELSRTKLVFLIIGCTVFAFAGLWMLQLDEASIRELRRLSNPTVFRSIGGITLLFAVLVLVFCLRKLFDKRPGLVLSAEGINDNSSGVAAGLIPWSDISGFDVYEIHKQKMLIILVNDPEKYIQRGNPAQRALHRANTKMVGSPISISSTTLKIGFDELCALVETYRARYLSPR
jgi:hypothetical protein